MPDQPMFIAYPSGDSTFTNVQNQWVELKVFSIVAANRGNHFNTSTDKFTAPVTGLYHFDLQAREETFYGSWGDIELAIIKNMDGNNTGSIVARMRHYTGTMSEESPQLHALIPLTANDTISAAVKTDTSDTQLAVEGGFTTFFTGHLVG